MNRPLNSAHAKEHALKCSKETHRRFERVSSSFLEEVREYMDGIVREIRTKHYPPIHAVVEPESGGFVTGEFMKRLEREYNDLIGRVIQAKVQRHPSCGRTLKGH